MTDSPGQTDQVEDAAPGEKHGTDLQSSEPNKRQKVESQATLEEILNIGDEPNKGEQVERQTTLEEAWDMEEEDYEDGKDDGGEPKTETTNTGATSKEESAVQPSKEHDMPSSILEKGIIYFFMRGRVGVDDPSGVEDVARSHIMLRPLEKDAKLGEGPIGDAGNTRLLALPKKVLPVSGRDRFMVFVQKSGASFEELKNEFLDSNDYETKTVGKRHIPAPAPIGEGVYAITTTGRESHLAYILTLPEKLGDLQTEMGLKEKGSFIISTKNPEQKGPANTQLPEGPEYPKEMMDEFRTLRWLPSRPEHLDYVNAQILLIGESSGLKKALQLQKDDEMEGKEEPKEVLEHLEEEDLNRMRNLPGDQSASVFADLTIHAKDYPKLETTFS